MPVLFSHRLFFVWGGLLFLLLGIIGGCAPSSNGGSSSSSDNSGNLNTVVIPPNRFQVTLPRFGPEIAQGYNQCTELAADIEQAGQWLANLTIDQQQEALELASLPLLTSSTTTTTTTTTTTPPITIPAASVIQPTIGDDLTNAVANDPVFLASSPTEGIGWVNFAHNTLPTTQEADIVQSDGQFLYLAYANELVVYDLSGNLLQRLALSETIEGLWVQDNKLIVLTESLKAVGSLSDDNDIGIIIADPVTGAATRTIVMEVNTDGTLNLLEDQLLNGVYQAAHEANGVLHIVTLTFVNRSSLTNQLSASLPEFQGLTPSAYSEAAYVKAQTVVPVWRDAVMQALLGDAEGTIDPGACEHLMKINRMQQNGSIDSTEDPDVTNGTGVLNAFAQISSFTIDDGLSSLSQAGAFWLTSQITTHLASDMIVLGGTGWTQTDSDHWQSDTFLTAFSLEANTAIPSAVGSVEGLVSQASDVDFVQSQLRVSSNLQSQWVRSAIDTWFPQVQSDNAITLLQVNGSTLETTGMLRNPVSDELHTTQFLGNRGFASSSQQTASVVIVDVANSTTPELVGEWNIPGYANTLFSVGDQHVLAVGQDADSQSQPTSLRAALWDLSDLTNPIETSQVTLSDWHSGTTQETTPAFRYLADEGLLIVPFSRSTISEVTDSFRLYSISTSEGIQHKGEIVHTNSDQGCFSGNTLDPRSRLVGTQLVTVKGHRIAGHTLADLSQQWNINLDESQTTSCASWFANDPFDWSDNTDLTETCASVSATDLAFTDSAWESCLRQTVYPLRPRDGLASTQPITANLACQATEVYCGYEPIRTLYNIQSVSGIENFSNLQRLDLSGLSLTSTGISGVEQLSNLLSLNLNSNQLSQLQLENMTQLRSLFSRDNQLTSITLSNLSRLADLDLANNLLTQVSLDGVPTSTRIQLSGNADFDCETLTESTRLQDTLSCRTLLSGIADGEYVLTLNLDESFNTDDLAVPFDTISRTTGLVTLQGGQISGQGTPNIFSIYTMSFSNFGSTSFALSTGVGQGRATMSSGSTLSGTYFFNTTIGDLTGTWEMIAR